MAADQRLRIISHLPLRPCPPPCSAPQRAISFGRNLTPRTQHGSSGRGTGCVTGGGGCRRQVRGERAATDGVTCLRQALAAPLPRLRVRIQQSAARWCRAAARTSTHFGPESHISAATIDSTVTLSRQERCRLQGFTGDDAHSEREMWRKGTGGGRALLAHLQQGLIIPVLPAAVSGRAGGAGALGSAACH